MKRVNEIAVVLRTFQNGLPRNSLMIIYKPFVRPHVGNDDNMAKETISPFIRN